MICLEISRYDDPVSEEIVVQINGEARKIPRVANVRKLLEHLEIGETRVAVEINRKLIRRREWETTSVENQDKVEIVQFVGGG